MNRFKPANILVAFQILILGLFVASTSARPQQTLPHPTAGQLAWENAELGIFFHYDLQVAYPHYRATSSWASHHAPFLSRTVPDTNQWLLLAKAMGARYAVYVCKHNSGYMFFQSGAYPFGLRQSQWGHGKADMFRLFVNSCHKYGIQPGLYCSLSTNNFMRVQNNLIHNGKGGTLVGQTAYAQICQRMETDLWSHYGPLFYCWFDGGTLPVRQGGPNLVPIVKKFQPDMVCFQGPPGVPGGLTRWIGNEAGQAPYPCWETVEKYNQSGAGDANGLIWEPAEVDISVLRNDHWFWHPGRPNPLLTLHKLVDIYYHSIGRGCNLIINAPINRYGRIAKPVRKRLAAFGEEIRRRFAHPLGETAGRGGQIVITFPQATTINNVMIMERISRGQRIRQYQVQGLIAGHWVVLCQGSSIGHERLQQFKAVKVKAVRLQVVKAIKTALISRFAVYNVAR
jgi:alpha-L-fucosidase